MARASLGVSDTFGGICPRSYCDLSLSPRIHLRFSPVPPPDTRIASPGSLRVSWVPGLTKSSRWPLGPCAGNISAPAPNMAPAAVRAS